MSYFITTERDSSVAMYRDTSISRYTGPKYLYNQLLSYFIISDLDICVSGYTATWYPYSQLLNYFIPEDLDMYVSGYLDTLKP
ncbi:MAG TPA: hypothetical protein VGI43_12925, partial [Mucilaginibacter sp.]